MTTTMAPLRLATRGSPLALWQANFVAQQLRPLVHPRAVELVTIQTHGDRVQDQPLAQIGGDGLFTKEVQHALLEHRADVAIHSLKDLPTAPVAGLTLAAVPPRGPTGDAFISRTYRRFDDLPVGATLASGSLRRRAQILHRRPDLRLVDLRGNIDTRLRKLDQQGLDGLVLAEAGLLRLGLAEVITEILDPSWMLPAVGQGALGLECRADDALTISYVRLLDDPATRAAVEAERALLSALGGGCLVPIGTATHSELDWLRLRAAVLAPDGSRRIVLSREGPSTQARRLGAELAADLLAAGADQLLALPRSPAGLAPPPRD